MAEAADKIAAGEPEAQNESAVKVFARVRQIMPWEEEKLGIKWTENSITNYGIANASREYKFTKALAPEMDNDEVFDIVIKPLITRVLDGYNSLVIAYGQTGAGKTYTLLGKPRLGVTGMLTRSLVEFLENKDVKEITLRAMEAYGIKPQRIDLFDLLNKENHTGDWSAKVGNSRHQIESTITNQFTIKTKEDCFNVIQQAQQSSHFAPTGKNPESSRGHIVFVIDVKGENENSEEISSSMVFADLAGSEGDSALTDEFIASVSEETLLARKLEGGVINVGLSELQLIFRDLMKKGKLSKSTGTGLIRMIKPYINQNTFISTVFCLSPSFVNCASTEATLRFAAQACQLKTSPAKAKRRINYENMASKLKEELQTKDELVEKLQACIAKALAGDGGASSLVEHIKSSGVEHLFDIDESAIHAKQSRKKTVVTPRMNRVKSEAMLAVESAEEDEQSWHVSRKNKKHRRMFSKHIDATQLEELAAKPLNPEFTVERHDNIVVQELIEEAQEDHHTRSWLAVMGQSLYQSRRAVGHRMTVWGGRVEKFFGKLARALYRKKRNSGEEGASDDMDTDILADLSGPTFSDTNDLPIDHMQNPGGEFLQSTDTMHSLAFDDMESKGVPNFDDLGGSNNIGKFFQRVDTEDVMRMDARE